MRNHHCGAPLHNFFERLLNVPFALGVQRAGGLVKQQQFRISENGAGQRDPLALTPRQPNPLCAQMTLVAVGKGIDKLMGMSHLRCGFDCLLARVAGTIGNVVKNVSGKQRRLLGNQSDLLAPAVEWYVAQVDAAKANRSGDRIIKPEHQFKDRRFSRARRPHQRQRLAVLYVQREGTESRVCGSTGISKMHSLERYGLLTCRHSGARIGNLAGLPEELYQAFGCACGALEVTPHFRKCGKSRADHDCVKDEGTELTARHAALDHIHTSRPHHADHAAHQQKNGKACQ